MDFLHRTWAEIDIPALIHNFKIIKNKAKNSLVMAVVKADAYGHRVEDIAPALEKAGADSFAVSNINEALQLRVLGIKKPILILGYTPEKMAGVLCENSITQCVYCSDYAQKLSLVAAKQNVKIKVHIKLDTGMSRIGFDCKNERLLGINEAISAAKLPNFIFEGVFTHFAVADRIAETEDGFTDMQYDLFNKAIEEFQKVGLNPQVCHCCNSAAILSDNEKHLNAVRPGIILYGLAPDKAMELKDDYIPVMTLKSVVSMVKYIEKGDTVNYGRTFKAEEKMKVATISAGYADGYPRILSNRGYVLIKGKKAPIIGRICMDQMSVDISGIDGVDIGDEVILFGKELPVEEIATLSNTINYEIVCGISSRVPRIILK